MSDFSNREMISAFAEIARQLRISNKIAMLELESRVISKGVVTPENIAEIKAELD